MQDNFNILAINPGSTSTKIALFENDAVLFEESIQHGAEELAGFARSVDQYELRRNRILSCLEAKNYNLSNLDAVVGRGGLLKPLESGTYAVNATMLTEMKQPGARDHASNLGVLLADEIAKQANAQAFTVDPVAVDELEPIARISGFVEIERKSLSHALNIKAVARRAAASLGKKYEELNLVVAHLGGGITVTAHNRGRMVDVVGGVDSGPFSPERSGSLPLADLIELCYSGKYTLRELMKKLSGNGGLVSYLGTNSTIEISERIANGDQEALLVAQAMAYQIAKSIGGLSTVLKGDVDGIVLTGGCARWEQLVNWIEDRVKTIAQVMVFPGENEMESLALGALRVLRSEEQAKDYQPR